MGLSSSATTLDGVRVVTKPPDITDARLHVVSPSLTHFPTRDQHQFDNQSVVFGWSGVRDISGIDYCQVYYKLSMFNICLAIM